MNIDKGLGNRILMPIYCACTLGIKVLGPAVQNPIGTNPGLTFNKIWSYYPRICSLIGL